MRLVLENPFLVLIGCDSKPNGSITNDVKLLKETWIENYKVKHYYPNSLEVDETSWTKDKIINGLKEAQSKCKTIHQELDGIIVAFLCHGYATSIVSSDNQKIKYQDIYNCFDSQQLPEFANKPKIFFMICCRASDRDDKKANNDEKEANNDEQNLNAMTRPTDINNYIVYATTEGHKLFNPVKGSYFVMILKDLMTKLERDSDLIKIILELRNVVLEKSCGYECVQEISTLKLKVIIKKRNGFIFTSTGESLSQLVKANPKHCDQYQHIKTDISNKICSTISNVDLIEYCENEVIKLKKQKDVCQKNMYYYKLEHDILQEKQKNNQNQNEINQLIEYINTLITIELAYLGCYRAKIQWLESQIDELKISQFYDSIRKMRENITHILFIASLMDVSPNTKKEQQKRLKLEKQILEKQILETSI